MLCYVLQLDSLQPLTLEYTGPKVYRVAVPSTSSGVPLKKYPDHDSSCSYVNQYINHHIHAHSLLVVDVAVVWPV